MRRSIDLLPFLVLISLGAEAQQVPTTLPDLELALVDLNGERDVIARVPGTVFAPRVSPDGRRVALDIGDLSNGPEDATQTIWIADIDDVDDRYELALVKGPYNYGPAWTPDGERVVFLASTPEGDEIYWRRADGSDDAELLLLARAPESWLLDGPKLSYLTLRGETDYGIAIFDLESRQSEPFLDLPGTAEHSSNISGDGRFIVYVSNASGDYEVFVDSLPPSGSPIAVTDGGGGHPIWSKDGRAIYFDHDGVMYRQRFDPSAGRPVGEVEALPITGFVQGPLRRQFDLMPNGDEFLMLFPL